MNPTDCTIYLDECAAGTLCGDLFIGAVVIKNGTDFNIEGVKDSKAISERRRKELFPLIIASVLDYEIVRISPEVIDTINILNARMEGFRQAILNLVARTGASYAVIDGNKVPSNLPISCECVVKGDSLIPAISAASIIAKHSHTEYVTNLCLNPNYSKYDLIKHKGYGTKSHLEALAKFGPIQGFHRFSFAPVRLSSK